MELMIFSLLCSIFSAFVPLLVKISMNWIYRVSKEEIILQNEATSLKKQMDAISMVDEFAKHARLQRKLIKVKDDLKEKATKRLASLMKNKYIFTYSMHIVMGLILMGIVWIYRSVPVIVFPEGRLWPITDIVSWPTGVPGGVSIVVWILMTNKIARVAAKNLAHRLYIGNKKGMKRLENGIMEKPFFLMQQTADKLH